VAALLPSRRLARAAPTALVLLAAAGCGTGPARHPPQPAQVARPASAGAKPDTSNPSTSLVACLGRRKVSARVSGPGTVGVDPASAGLKVRFLGTDGDAQAAQLQGSSEGAEVILNALVYVGNATDAQIKPVEDCVAKVAK
jgi:hypothetical protein